MSSACVFRTAGVGQASTSRRGGSRGRWGGSARRPWWRWRAASRFIAHELGRRDMLIRPDQTHDWLIRDLGLDAFPIKQRV